MTSPAPQRLCTFAVGGLRLAVPVADVVEVVRGQRVVHVPHAPEAVLGILNLRGRIVPVLDARLRLGLEPRDPAASCAHVIVSDDDELVSLVVDREGDVVVVDPAAGEAVPETVAPDLRRLATTAYQLDGALLLVLDPRLVLTPA